MECGHGWNLNIGWAWVQLGFTGVAIPQLFLETQDPWEHVWPPLPCCCSTDQCTCMHGAKSDIGAILMPPSLCWGILPCLIAFSCILICRSCWKYCQATIQDILPLKVKKTWYLTVIKQTFLQDVQESGWGLLLDFNHLVLHLKKLGLEIFHSLILLFFPLIALL